MTSDFSSGPRPIYKAFVLGAGLGTRLLPLTERLPKPLIPVFGRPLITFAFDQLIESGVRDIMVNTHHCADAYRRAFPEPLYKGAMLHFRHEPVLLETGGGIWNVRDWAGDDPFWVFNGDVFSTIPLQKTIEQHRSSHSLATLILRTEGGPLQIAYDSEHRHVIDIRNRLNRAEGNHLFTGIYLIEPALISRIAAGQKISIVETFLDVMRSGGHIGGIVVNEGDWRDLGTRNEYSRLHRDIIDKQLNDNELEGSLKTIHAMTCQQFSKTASHHGEFVKLEGTSWIGEGVKVGRGSHLVDTYVWNHGRVADHITLKNCIVREGMVATENATDRVF